MESITLTTGDLKKHFGMSASEFFGSPDAARSAAGGTRPYAFTGDVIADRLKQVDAADPRHERFAQILADHGASAPVADIVSGAEHVQPAALDRFGSRARSAVGVAAPLMQHLGTARVVGRRAAPVIALVGLVYLARRKGRNVGGAGAGAGAENQNLEVRSASASRAPAAPKPPTVTKLQRAALTGTTPLEQKVAATLAKSAYGAATSLIMWDAKTGTPLVEVNPDAAKIPASTTKTLTALAVLDEYGPNKRFQTKIVTTGAVDGGVLTGDIIIVGGGDPSLTLGRISSLAKKIAAAGITRIDGRIVVDDSSFDQQFIAPGDEVHAAVGEVGPIGALTTARLARGDDGVTISGTDPGIGTGTLFRDALQSAGVSTGADVVRGRAPSNARKLASTSSAPLGELVKTMLTHSNNMYAETLVQHVGRSHGGTGSTAAGVAAVRERLQALGVSMDGSIQVDGSGLAYRDMAGGTTGPGNVITPRTLASVMEAGTSYSKADVRTAFTDALSVAGAAAGRGTLAGRMNDLDGVASVVGKTGTVRDAITRSGIVTEGRTSTGYVFMTNKDELNKDTVRSLDDNLTRDIVDHR